MKNILTIIVMISILPITLLTFSCTDAIVASANLSRASDQFEVYRRVVFFNGITDKYILTIEGFCSVKKDTQDNQLEVTVKTGPNRFVKHYLGISDNVTYFVEQLDSAIVSKDRYRVIFKPSVIIPNVDLE